MNRCKFFKTCRMYDNKGFYCTVTGGKYYSDVGGDKYAGCYRELEIDSNILNKFIKEAVALDLKSVSFAFAIKLLEDVIGTIRGTMKTEKKPICMGNYPRDSELLKFCVRLCTEKQVKNCKEVTNMEKEKKKKKDKKKEEKKDEKDKK